MVAVIISNLLAVAATLISLALFVRGVVHLITGKCNIRGNALRGRTARLAGLLMVAQLFVGFGVYAVIFESFEMGGSAYRSAEGSIVSAMAQTIPVLVAAIGAYLWALFYAKAHKPEELQPGG